MKTTLKMMCALCCLVMAAHCTPDPVLSETNYELVSLELSYPEIPQEGGKVAPVLSYEYMMREIWSNGEVKETRHKDGCTPSYTISNDLFAIDLAGGVTAGANDGFPRRAEVTVSISAGGRTWEKTAAVKQAGVEALVEYSGLQIEEFSYPDIPSEGGSALPTLVYSYQATYTREDGSAETITCYDGASVAFAPAKAEAVDQATGEITLKASTAFEPTLYSVLVEVMLPDGTSATCQASVAQDALEDYVVKEEVRQLDIVLGEHTCVAFGEGIIYEIEDKYISNNKDGKVVYPIPFYNDEGRVLYTIVSGREFETVSATGADIPFSGGELASITEWASGRLDTLVIKEPVYSDETSFTPEVDYSYNTGSVIPIDETQVPVTSIDGNIWHFNSLGTQKMKNVLHTLKATVDGRETTLSLYQSNNDYVREIMVDQWCEILEVDEAELTRLTMPEFEDYRPGGKYYSSGYKWEKVYGGYIPGWATKYLHWGDDANRAVQIRIDNTVKNMATWERKYTSGAKAQSTGWYYTKLEDGTSFFQSFWYNNINAEMTATASVRMKDGSIRNIEHKWEWTKNPIRPKSAKDKYRGETFTMFIPEVKDAAEDFEWTISIDITLIESVCRVVWENPDYSKLHATFRLKDCMETFGEFCASQGIEGPFASITSSTVLPVTPLQHGQVDWEVTADIADGLPREEYLATPYDQLPGR